MDSPIEKNSNDLNLKNWKVKLFILNSEGSWDDYGCGVLSFLTESSIENDLYNYICIQKIQEDNENLIVDQEKIKKIKNENIIDCLLYVKIEKDYVFEKQHDFIISWADQLLNEEFALSFIDPIAANETWRKISLIAKIQPEIQIDIEDLKIFPTVTEESLDLIIAQLEVDKEKMIKSALFNNKEIFVSLNNIFTKAENELNEELIRKLIILIKSLIYSGDTELIEIALNDNNYLVTYGILEYDGIEKLENRNNFRKFLTEQIIYKKVVDIKSNNILSKIHLNYRINFLYDCILEPIMDEARPNPFNKIVYYNNCEILDYILSDSFFLDRFCQNFLTHLEDSLDFLKEFLDMIKTNIQFHIKLFLIEKFEAFGFIEKLVLALPKIKESQMVQEKRIKYLILLIENFSYLMQIKTKSLIDLFYLNPNKEIGRNFITNLVEILLSEDEGVQVQVTDFIKQLLDPNSEEKQQILTYLYDVLFVELYQGYERMIESECFYFFAQQYIDILIFCIQTHNSRIRYYIIKNEIIQHVLKGLILKKKIISLIIAKFYKAIIQSKDEFLIRYLETRNLLKPLMDHFSKPIHKSEMFKSIILDIIKTIYIENNEILKKQLEDYDIMSTSLFKNVKANAQQLKSKQIFLKDHKLNMLPTNERISDCGVDKKVVKKQGILNLNYLDEEDGDLIVKDFDDLPKNENYEINNKIGDILYEGVISNDEKIIKNNLNEKRVHPTNEDIQYLEQDTTRMKKVKLE